MRAIKTISVPEPCKRHWEQMHVVDSGRHCESCCKTVVDFTVMNNAEIIAFLSVNNNACGHFNRVQLQGLNNSLNPGRPPRSLWINFLSGIVLGISFSSYKANAQGQAPANLYQIRKDSVQHIYPRRNNKRAKPVGWAEGSVNSINIDVAPTAGSATASNLGLNEIACNSMVGGISVKGYSFWGLLLHRIKWPIRKILGH